MWLLTVNYSTWCFIISGLLILCDGAILHNWPQIAYNHTIHEKNRQKFYYLWGWLGWEKVTRPWKIFVPHWQATKFLEIKTTSEKYALLYGTLDQFTVYMVINERMCCSYTVHVSSLKAFMTLLFEIYEVMNTFWVERLTGQQTYYCSIENNKQKKQLISVT